MTTKNLIKKSSGQKTSVQRTKSQTRNEEWELGRKEGIREGMISTSQKLLFDLVQASFVFIDKKTLATICSIRDIKALQTLFKKGLLLYRATVALRRSIIEQAAKANDRHNGRDKTARNH